jgi:organic radical activating enzyme
MNSLLGKYINGNYNVKIYSDGTKIRESLNPEDNYFISDYPECIDLKITNMCNLNCKYCHEDSKLNGKHGELLNNEFINTLLPYTEIAIGGGNPLEHPQLIEFLELLKSRNIIANITVNQKHFMLSQLIISQLVKEDLIKGLGVSFIYSNASFINIIKQYPNAVIHIINGITKMEDLKSLFKSELKILILGYKKIRKGKDYYSSQIRQNQFSTYINIFNILNSFKVVSFDNLALKQLKIKDILPSKVWNEFYMGDDGQHTMYIDLVEKQFSKSSTTIKRYNLMDNIQDMFNIIKMDI